ncbi:gas vesicle protein [Oxynema sp. CENA135]|uniref:gas vesicle protein GvpJ n=1 Tax=Oxynema sp. CENA135 TaxID=984206 RepID=UPI00190E5707|nr:gas vesicle protein [Oxynema sp. CENA135]
MSSTPIQPKNYPSSSHRAISTSTQSSSLADILERVLDKGIVIAGDISISIATTELLHIRIRLLISSVDKAKEMGINWWENDPYLSSKAQALISENQQLQDRLNQLEAEVRSLRSLTTNPVELSTDDRPSSEPSPGEAPPDSPA